MKNVFDYSKAILENKKQLIVDELSEKEYNSFLTNRSLSYHMDCIMFANEMNLRHHSDNKLQNDFLLNTVRSRKRPFSKWIKPEKSEDLECIQKIYNLSNSKAKEILRILRPEEIQHIKEQLETGGLRK